MNAKLKRLKASLNNPNWSGQERDCIEQLSASKKHDQVQLKAIENLLWRLSMIERSEHVRVKQHYEA